MQVIHVYTWLKGWFLAKSDQQIPVISSTLIRELSACVWTTNHMEQSIHDPTMFYSFNGQIEFGSAQDNQKNIF